MNEPRRPDADLTLAERLRELMLGRPVENADTGVWSADRDRTELGGPNGPGGADPNPATTEVAAYSPIVLGAIGVGAVIAILGMFLAWQAWSSRSAAPIDDALPFLIDTAGDTAEGNGVGDTDSEGGSGGDDANPTLITAPAQTVPTPAAIEGEQAELDLEPAPTTTPAPILVHVSGAVTEPGVVELVEGARAIDALGAAGGALADTDLDRVNLAAPMFDGERLHFPVIGEDDVPQVVDPVRSLGFDDDGYQFDDARSSSLGVPTPTPRPAIVDINTADLVELQLLPGIGPAMASRIIEKRLSYGFFCTVDELIDIRGIGPETLESLRAFVAIRSADCLGRAAGG